MTHTLKRQRGISLIEVLVSLMILALGLLGLSGLQSRAMLTSQSSYYRSIAADLAADLAERIRANRSPYLASSDADAIALPPDFARCARDSSGSISCSNQTGGRSAYQVAAEMAAWNTSLVNSLPNASFTLSSSAGSSTGLLRYVLTINWADNRGKTSSTDTAATSYITVIE